MSAQLKYDIKIFIIGMMGAGKSSVGLALSQLIDIPFIDIDELIGIDSYFDVPSTSRPKSVNFSATNL